MGPTARVPLRGAKSGLQAIKDTGPGQVERGRSRWVAGWAIIAAGGALVLSTFLEWGNTTSAGFAISMSGLGQVSVEAPDRNGVLAAFIADRLQQESSVHTPGVWALLVGLIAIVAGAAYLWTQWRSQTALAVTIVGGIEFLVCVGNAINVAAMMGHPAGDAGQYAIGFGLLLACAITLVLVGLGITAFVLERISIGARLHG
jgi:hypothetical protein